MALSLVAFVALWLGTLGVRALVSADEGRYAALSLAMLQSGDWVTPRLNGLLYFEKPPLQYWAGAISIAVFGINEFAVRFWPGLCGLAIVALVGTTARALWGGRAGLAGLLIAGSTTWIVVNSHFLSLDTGLAAALTLVLCAVLRAQRSALTSDAARWRWVLVAWAGMGLAVLSKGPIGVVIPGAALVLQSLWRRDFAFWRRLEWPLGIGLLLLIAAPWFVLVSARNPDFARFFFVHEHLQRFLTPVHQREGAWWYFMPFVLVGFLPWTSALPWLWRGAKADAAVSLLLAWAAFVLIFFSTSSSKLPSYILPMFPALALLLARAFAAQSPATQSTQVSTRTSTLIWHLLVPSALWAVAGLAAPWAGRLAADPARQPGIAALAHGVEIGSLLFIAGAIAAWWLLRRQRIMGALAAVAVAHLCATLLVMSSHDAYGQSKSAREIARILGPQIDAATPVYAVRAYDQTLPFYLRRPVTLVDYVDEFDFGERHEPDRWVPTTEAFVARWLQAPKAAAYLSPPVFDALKARGVAMRVVFSDPRRVVVVKP